MTSSIYHLCIQLKYDVGKLSLGFVKPHCFCFMPQYNKFWGECDNVLNATNQLVSTVLQMLCDTSDCLCLEFMHSTLDEIFRFLQSLMRVLTDCKQYIDYGMIPTLVENNGLIVYLESSKQSAVNMMHRLYELLQMCSQGHYNVLSKYNACGFCTK